MKRTIVFLAAISFLLGSPQMSFSSEVTERNMTHQLKLWKNAGSQVINGVSNSLTKTQKLCISLEDQSAIITGNTIFMKQVPNFIKNQSLNGDIKAQKLTSTFLNYVLTKREKDIRKFPKTWTKFWEMSFFFSLRSYKCSRSNQNAIDLIRFLHDLNSYLLEKQENEMANSMKNILAIVGPYPK